MHERDHFTNGRCLAVGAGLAMIGSAFSAQIAGWQHWITIGIVYGCGITVIVIAAYLIGKSHIAVVPAPTKVVHSSSPATTKVGGPNLLMGMTDNVTFHILPSDTSNILTSDQVETLDIAKELQRLLSSLPADPAKGGFDRSPYGPDIEDQVRMMNAYSSATNAWSEQLGHAYVASKLSERLTNLTHKLGAQKMDVSGLEPYCKWMGSGDMVRATIDELWRLAKEMQQP